MGTPFYLPPTGPQRHPSNGTGASQGVQTEMGQVLNPPTPFHWIERLYEITRAVVTEHYGQDALAADMSVARQGLNLRLNRKPDSKGDVQRLYLDTWAHLMTDPGARWELLERLCAECGAKPPEPVVTMTDSEKLRLVLGELPEKRLRQIEREKGLPAGSLS